MWWFYIVSEVEWGSVWVLVVKINYLYKILL